MILLPPGAPAHTTGRWITTSMDGTAGHPFEIMARKGDTLPLTPRPGDAWMFIQRAMH